MEPIKPVKKLAIITTHPIQYYAPVFKLLHARSNIAIKVFYTKGKENEHTTDAGFGKKVVWDVPLLDGYPYQWVKNTAVNAGSHHFKGIKNPDLVKQIETWDPDAVLFFGWAYHGHLKAIRYFKNKKTVYFRGDSTLLNERGKVREILKYLFLRWVYSYVDHAFYVGTNNRAYFEKYGLKGNQLIFAPHAIDNERFETNRIAEAAELRSSLQIPDNEVLLLYCGKFETVKNVELLISAFNRLSQPRTHLLIVGNGALEERLKTVSAQNDRIYFLDFKNQSFMPTLYQAADLFCLPSLSETWGLAVNEAMACKKAILVSDKVGCAADLVKDNINGLVFKSENMDDLVKCLKQLTRSKDVLTSLGQNSAEIIKEWNFLKIAEAIENKLINEAS